MRLDKFGNPIFNTQDIFKFLYQGKLTNLKDLTVDYTEDIEKLEQLRMLYAGYKIGVVTSKDAPMSGVDTPEDLTKLRKLLSS